MTPKEIREYYKLMKTFSGPFKLRKAGISTKHKDRPRLFCTFCGKYIKENSFKQCPYCGKGSINIFLACKVCRRDVNLIECPFCNKTIEIDNSAGEKIFKIKTAEQVGAEVGEGLIKLSEKFGLTKKLEELKNQFLIDEEAVFQKSKKEAEDEIKLKELLLQKTKIEADIEGLKNPKDKDKNPLEDLKKELKAKIERKKIYQDHDAEEFILNFRKGFLTRQALVRAYDELNEEITKNSKYTAKEREGLLNNLDDLYNVLSKKTGV